MRMSRRGLLIGALAGGGLAVGYMLRPRDFPLPLSPGRDEIAFDAWIKIAGDGVVSVAVPQLEMGQGISTLLPQIVAAAPFYGSAPALEDVPKIKAELLVVLAASDERVNASWPPYEQALKGNGVRYALLQPPGTQHGFNNDTTPRYDPAAAAEAWKQTVALFKRTLKPA